MQLFAILGRMEVVWEEVGEMVKVFILALGWTWMLFLVLNLDAILVLRKCNLTTSYISECIESIFQSLQIISAPPVCLGLWSKSATTL